jgi:hypothetical protein
MPIRIQRRRVKGWKKPENTINVCRPGFFGNPFKVGKDSSNEYAVSIYEDWLKEFPEGRFTAKKAKELLRGKNLMCFCSLDQPCHADVLLRIANE